ncbi:histone acetyltransferase KAT2A-like [Drosophila busckii]|uniref:histone acetyltransferase KAT2A-like n=1 Tax=Drosophila busckii TaxID=30019 RepID=UPI001432C774|nr:histone acetyltransferase KAT2A-like [Drosophila busckii]
MADINNNSSQSQSQPQLVAVKRDRSPAPTAMNVAPLAKRPSLAAPQSSLGGTLTTVARPPQLPGSAENNKREVKLLMQSVKSMFIETLPQLSPDLINKFVFGGEHKILVLVLGDQVVGGISFRSFQPQGFAEIAICAVKPAVARLGHQLMNMFKYYLGLRGIKHLLTHADRSNVAYYREEGFSERIRIPVAIYLRHVKHDMKTKLMHCELKPVR